MSKLRKSSEYKKTFSFKFSQWLNGEKDPYLNQVEMKVQERVEEKEETIQERMHERQMIRDKIYDVSHNKELRLFNKFYKISSVFFCIILIGILVYTVSYLPETGR